MKDIKIEKLDQSQVSQFHNLITLFNEVFESPDITMASRDYCKKMLSDPKFIVLTANDNDGLAGGITAHILPSYYSGKEEVYVYDIAVSETRQRKGVGTALMQELFAIVRNINIEVVFVDAENEDTGALNFYQKLGGTSLSVSQFTYQL